MNQDGVAARAYLSYVIRRVEALDASGVYAVEKACFNDPYPFAVLSDLINKHQDRFFVASYHEEIVGYAVASANAMEGHVVSVAVDPRHRRRRIGTALLSAVSTKLVEEGIEQIRLEVRKGNAGAIAFYDQMGYTIFSEIRNYYADGEDALVLARSEESCAPVRQ
jgi:ribosomal-protein-alanine N-acetyltransferase